MTFKEHPNTEGQNVKRPRRSRQHGETQSETVPVDISHGTETGTGDPAAFPAPKWPPGTWQCPPSYPQGPPGWFGWPGFTSPYGQPPFPYPPTHQPTWPSTQPPQSSESKDSPLAKSSRQRDWRHRKAEKEDKERAERGEEPKKRHKKTGQYKYLCTICQQRKCVETGHTQVRGKWYCPSMEISKEEWKRQLPPK